MHAVTTDTGEYAMTSYVGGLASPELARLREVWGDHAVTPVATIPYSLLRPTGCMELVGVAERDSLRWQLSPLLAGESLCSYLRVYTADYETLANCLWDPDGAWVEGSHSSWEDARDAVEEYAAGDVWED